ncbi:MAG: tetratricopeptide repeat protein [Chlamydiia bacterium]
MQVDNYLSVQAKKQVESIIQKVRSNTDLTPLDIIELSLKDLELIYSMAYTFYETGQYTKAKALFLKLVLSSPFTAAYWKGIGCVCQMLQETQDALIYYGVASLIDPEDPMIHLYAAKVLIDLSRFEEARGALIRAESLAPKEDLDFQTQLEVLYERTTD